MEKDNFYENPEKTSNRKRKFLAVLGSMAIAIGFMSNIKSCGINEKITPNQVTETYGAEEFHKQLTAEREEEVQQLKNNVIKTLGAR